LDTIDCILTCTSIVSLVSIVYYSDCNLITSSKIAGRELSDVPLMELLPSLGTEFVRIEECQLTLLSTGVFPLNAYRADVIALERRSVIVLNSDMIDITPIGVASTAFPRAVLDTETDISLTHKSDLFGLS